MSTTIEWTDETWNPTLGCSKVSPGCDNCYAIGVAHRAMQPAHAGLTVVREGERPDWTGEVRTLPDRLDTPLHWRKPRRVFVDSMSDLFHPDVPVEFIADVFAVMRCAERHTFQVLTKRPQRMTAVLDDARWPSLLQDALRRMDTHMFSGPATPNVWLGTSIESDRYAWRADHLARTPAAVRFLSLEPLIGPLPSLNLADIDWVIVGGESGPGARPMHPEWVRDIQARCSAARVPFFFKQWGDWLSFTHSGLVHCDRLSEGLRQTIIDLDGQVLGSEVPCEIDREPSLMLHVGKKAAGRILDGRTWDEMPGEAAA